MSKSGFIYAIGAEGESAVKIGKTAHPVAQRLTALQVGYPARLQVRASVPVHQDLSRVEKAIHHLLQTDRQHGEWFAIQVDQGKLETLIAQAAQWVRDQDARKAAIEAERLAAIEAKRLALLEAERLATIQAKKVATQRQAALTPEGIGKRMRQRRRALDITQEALEELSGVKQSHISALESDRIQVVKSDTLVRIAKALRVSTDWLLELPEDMGSEMEPTMAGVA